MIFNPAYSKATLDYLFGSSSTLAQYQIISSLHTGDPTLQNEVSVANGYARQPTAFSPADPVTGVASNLGIVHFGPCVNAAWGTITHVGLWDISSGVPQLLTSFALLVPRAMSVGDELTAYPGSFRVSIR